MKLVLKALIVVWVVVMVVGLVLPNEYEIRRSITIAAEQDTIHSYTEDLQQWTHWQPWVATDPSVKITLGEISKGSGASQSWTSESGDGALLFTQSNLESGIHYDISFNNGANQAQARLTYTPVSYSETQVEWTMKGQIETPIFGAYLAFFMDSMVGPSFELGLFKLKKLVETGKPL